MAERRTCKHCLHGFSPRSQNPDQQYCSEQACQRACKRHWQQQKLLADADYQANQRAAQRFWAENHPDYWRHYRQRNPDYVAGNRQRQGERNHRRCEQGAVQLPIAKMDASIPESLINPGRYLLTRIESGLIAKMDALIVERSTFLRVVSTALALIAKRGLVSFWAGYWVKKAHEKRKG